MCREKAVAGDLVPLVTAHSRGGRPHHLRGPGVLGSPGGRTGWRGPRPRLGMVGWHVPSASGLERPVGRGQREATVGTSPYHPDWTGCGTQNTCLGASSGRARWWPGGSFPTPPPTPTHPPTPPHSQETEAQAERSGLCWPRHREGCPRILEAKPGGVGVFGGWYRAGWGSGSPTAQQSWGPGQSPGSESCWGDPGARLCTMQSPQPDRTAAGPLLVPLSKALVGSSTLIAASHV